MSGLTLTATEALSAVIEAPDLDAARAAARAGLDRLRHHEPSDILDVGEAAYLAGRPESTIRRWAHRYKLGRKIGGRWWLSRRRFVAFVAEDAA